MISHWTVYEFVRSTEQVAEITGIPVLPDHGAFDDEVGLVAQPRLRPAILRRHRGLEEQGCGKDQAAQ